MADLEREPLSETTAPTEVHNGGITRYLFIIGLGLLATTLPQDASLGYFPIQFHLKERLNATELELARFSLLGGMAWYLKPLFGLIADSVPLFGSRRRNWIILSALVTGVMWIVLGMAAGSYKGMLYADLGMNAGMVMASTVVGGLLVVEGQRHGATGRFSSLRLFIQNGSSLIMGLAGGYLATKAFGLTAGICAAIVFLLVVGALFYLPEDRDERPNTEVWRDAWMQLKELLRSKTMWGAAGLVFLLMVSPGFGVPFLYYQRDTLHFSRLFIGTLASWSGLAGLVAASAYAYVSTRVNLRPLLTLGIALSAMGTLTYLLYHSKSAALWIEPLNGFIATLALVPLMDLLTRATPPASGSFGYALLISVYNIAMKLSSYLGAWLHDDHGWTIPQLILLNAATTALVLVFIPFLPAALMNRRDGQVGA